MILDTLENSSFYRSLGKRFELAFKALADGVSNKPNGKYELDGENVFASVMRYPTKPLDKGKWEAHRKYIDVQYIASGEERMAWDLVSRLKSTAPFDAAKDIEFFTHTGGEFFNVRAGMFAIFFPHDGHMPSLQIDGPVEVCKTVVKIAV